MPSVKISGLTAAASAVGTQEFEVNESGISKKVTGSQIATYVESEVSSSPSFTGQASFADGTAALPSITNTGDPNTGMLFPAADTVALSTAGTQRVTVDSVGRVGIGTTLPEAVLDINGNAFVRGAGSEGGEIAFFNSDRTTVGMTIDISSAANVGRIFQAENNSTLQLGQLVGTGGAVTLHTAANERMRINSSGNVGIGKTNPAYPLEVVSDIAASGFATYGRLVLRSAEGTVTAPTQITASTNLGILDFLGNNATPASYNTVASIRGISDGAITSTSSPGFLTFRTTASGSVSTTERLRIASAGQIGIGGANYGTSGQVLTSGGASAAPSWGNLVDYQVFTASGTWTKPAGISADAIVFVRMWAGGGGGHPTSFNGGGGGGGYGELWLKASDLGATEAVTVGGGGAAGAAGGNTTFDGRTVFGGGAGLTTPGGAGGNSFSQGPQAGSGSPSAVSFLGGTGSSAVLGYGGAGEFWGGGAGGHDQGDGGQAIWGGGGGAGGTGGALGGASTFGGIGGAPNGAGSAPAGGGGGGATAGAGARGEVRVWIIG